MRKNGVNRQLIPIDGGVCAPVGFSANAVRCGFLTDTVASKEDLALIVANKNYPTAFVGANSAVCGAPILLSNKHLRAGKARAIIVNSGVANAIGDGAYTLSEEVCRAIAKRLRADANEIVIASTGKLGEKISLQTFLNGMDALVQGLSSSNENSLVAARAIMTDDVREKQLAFSFEIGDITCKIGAICKGNTQVSPNMATTICVLTTDVNITSEMLQKALFCTVNDTLNMLCIDGVSSPNDCVCIMASGEAGNYKISANDSEYAKFIFALGETMDRICRLLASERKGCKQLLICKTFGAQSKRVARLIAKSAVRADGVKNAFACGVIDVQNLLCAIIGTNERVDINKIVISVKTKNGQITVFEDGTCIHLSEDTEKRLLDAGEIECDIHLFDGNYSATAYGCIFSKEYSE